VQEVELLVPLAGWWHLGISAAQQCCVQGETQAWDKNTCFSKFQRIKEDMADGCKEVK